MVFLKQILPTYLAHVFAQNVKSAFLLLLESSPWKTSTTGSNHETNLKEHVVVFVLEEFQTGEIPIRANKTPEMKSPQNHWF